MFTTEDAGMLVFTQGELASRYHFRWTALIGRADAAGEVASRGGKDLSRWSDLSHLNISWYITYRKKIAVLLTTPTWLSYK